MKLVASAVTALLLLTIAKIAEPLLMTSGENQKGHFSTCEFTFGPRRNKG
jgi:hypothetical protein